MAFTNGNDFQVNISVNGQDATKAIQAFFQGLEQGAKEAADEVGKAGEKVKKFGDSFSQVKLDSLLNNLGRLKVLAGEAFTAISRGSELNDLNDGLDRLAKQAGTTGDVLLKSLRAATAGTISDFDLLGQAVKGLNADLTPDQIVTITQAARALGDTLGGDTKSKVEQFTNAVVTGRAQFLKQVGVYVDAKKANEDFAKSIGKTVEQLTEEEQRIAFQAEAVGKLKAKYQEIGPPVKDAGDAIQIFGASLDNATDKLTSALAADNLFNAGLNELARIIGGLDFGPLIGGLTSVFDYATSAASAVVDFGVTIANLAGSIDNPHLEGAAKAIDSINESLDLRNASEAKAKLEALDKVVNQLPAGLQKIALQKTLAPQIAAANKEIKDLQGQFRALNPWFQKTTTEVKKTGDATKVTTAALHGNATAQQSATENTRKLATAHAGGGKAAKDYASDAQAAKKAIEDLAAAEQKAEQDTVDFIRAIKESGNSLSDALSVEDGGKGATDSSLTTAKNIFGTDAGNFFGFDVGLSDQVASAATSALSTGLQAGIDAAFGGDFDFSAFQDLASNMAGSIADAFLPGSGPIVGALTHGIVGLFESKDSAGTAARKEADKYFADLFDANRLSVIIDGQLKQIKDLVFTGQTAFGGNVGGGTGGFFDFLKTLPGDVQAAFAGVGTAFEEMLGIGEDVGGQLAAVFANNVGGSLNNLQLLVYATGKSFEELKNSVVDAFLNGKISANEAVVAMNGLRQVMTKGIPDGVGQTVQAFNNLKAAGVKGGRAATDAIRDIAFEAHELGIRDIPGAIRQMVATGQVGAEEVQQVFDALAANGITSLEQLAGASDERLIGVVARLHDVGFAFKDPVDGAAALVDKLNELESKEVTLNIQTKTDKNFDKAYEMFKAGGSSGSSDTGSTEAASTGTNAKSLKLRRAAINGRADDIWTSTDAPPRYISDEGDSGSGSSSSRPSSSKTSGKTATQKTAQQIAKENKEAIEKATDSLKNYYNQIENVAEGSDRYKAIIEAISKGTISSDKGQRLLNATYQDAEDKVKALREAERARDEILKKVASGEKISKGTLNAYEKAVYDAKKAVDEFGKSADKLAKDPLAGFFRIGAVTNLDSVVSALGGSGKFDAKAAQVINDYIKNFSGDANKLGVILHQVGVNAEDAKKLIVDSFNAGQISATQAAKAIKNVGQALGDGIPDKVGAFTDAFQNFLKDGISGGAFTIDDLKDIFAEAKEAGITDLGTLQAQLVESGKFTADQVAKLYKTLYDNNINTLDQAVGISDEVGIAITAAFYDAKGGIADANSEVSNLIGSLNALQQGIYIAKVEIQTTVTGDGAEFLTGDGVLRPENVGGAANLKTTGGSGGSNKSGNNKNNNKNNGKGNNRTTRPNRRTHRRAA